MTTRIRRKRRRKGASAVFQTTHTGAGHLERAHLGRRNATLGGGPLSKLRPKPRPKPHRRAYHGCERDRRGGGAWRWTGLGESKLARKVARARAR